MPGGRPKCQCGSEDALGWISLGFKRQAIAWIGLAPLVFSVLGLASETKSEGTT